MAGTSDDGSYDGCDITCEEGNMLLVDPRNGGNWRCIRSGPNYCPGKFNTGSLQVGGFSEKNSNIIAECACEGGPDECPIGDCDCDGQLRVSHDCKTARLDQGCYLVYIPSLCRYCNETLSTGYETITCDDPDQIVYVDLDRHFWHCAVVRYVMHINYERKMSRMMVDAQVHSMLDARKM